jgi:hypothetical protein
MENKAPEVYKTMASVKPETIQYLTGWRKPNYAYILFEKRQFHLSGTGTIREGTGLMTLNVQHRPEQSSKLFYYTGASKRYKIIDYGNFPKINDNNPERAKLARLHSGPNGKNPWDALESQVKFLMESGIEQDKVKKLEIEKAGLEAKLAQALAKDKKEIKSGN